MNYRGMLLSMALAALFSQPLFAADWPQWRGPNQDGIAAASPALVDTLTPETMKKVWESEPIPSGDIGGFSQPAVADDRVYVIQSIRHLSLGTLVNELTEGGKVPAEELAKLGPIPEKNFVCLADFEDWLKTRDVSPEAIEAILQPVGTVKRDTRPPASRGYLWSYVGTKRTAATDVLWAFDRKTGKTIYKTEFPGQWLSYPVSSTPTVVDGRVYILSSNAVAHCIDAATGKQIWECPLIKKPRFQHCRASSPILIDGKIIVACEGEVAGIDAKTGEKIWSNTKTPGKEATAVAHKFGDRTVAIFAGATFGTSRPDERRISALDPATGETIWVTEVGQTSSMPVIANGVCVLSSRSEAPGVVAYKVDEKQAEVIWTVPFINSNASMEFNYPCPVIDNGFVY
ncbi:MAG: PQQ-like beta-propeller repeat protein, partial [Phycisphaerales bacterium]|nr:PQQ-like beta-propeller repeat protein [Phycisphaerales bacterium]